MQATERERSADTPETPLGALVPAKHCTDVVVCYWLGGLVALYLFFARRENEVVRFHAIQSMLLTPLLFVPLVNVVALVLALTGGAMALAGRGLRLPGLSHAAAAWA